MINIDSTTTIRRPAGEVFTYVNNWENARMWLSGFLETRATSEAEGVGFTWIDVV